ncbi:MULTISPECIES: hypothetical protein [unclassified Corynebacterium]|uniref:hypothetical protein n=1 Tax=unclassified Corynebacterium TaxID=2624378 RepID=UPI0035243845
MRTPTHRLLHAFISGAVALTLATGAVTPAATADTTTGTSAVVEEAVEVAKKADSGSADLGSVSNNNFSAQIGANGLQKWYDGSPSWARVLLSVAAVALALDALGVIVGPVRSMLLNLLPR